MAKIALLQSRGITGYVEPRVTSRRVASTIELAERSEFT
jgi:hypothetical protein